MHSLINLREISLNKLHHVPVVCGQLNLHKITATATFTCTKSSSLNVFTMCSPGSYFVHLNVDPSADLVYHSVSVHVKYQWTKLSFPTDVVGIITDDSMTIGEVQKMDIEEEMAIDSGVKIFQEFIGQINFTTSFIYCMCPRVKRSSTYEQAHLVASKIVDKKETRKSLRQLSLHVKEIINHSSSSTTLNNLLHSNLDKKASKPTNKTSFKR